MRVLKMLIARLLIMAMVVVFTFCDNQDEEPQSFSYEIDGVPQKIQSVKGELTFQVEFDHEERILVLTAVGEPSNTLCLTITNWDFSNPPNNGIIAREYPYFEMDIDPNDPNSELVLNENVTLRNGIALDYVSDDIYYSVSYDENIKANIEITSCNSSKHLVSGTFSFKLEGYNKLITLKGSFTNVKYSVD